MNRNFILNSLEKQASFVKLVSKNENCNSFLLWLNWIKCYICYGATPSDWFVYEMYKYNFRSLKNIITRRKNLILDKKFNPRKYRQIFDDKYLFNKEYSDFVNRSYLCCKDASKEDIFNFLKSHEEVVVKPLNLSSGKGIHLFNSSNGNIEKLYEEVYGKDFLLEEKVELVEELKRLNPPSCQTLRIYTMITKTGQVDIIDTILRVGGGKGIQDNFHSKGVIYRVDKNIGVVIGKGKDLMKNEYLQHPSTQILMPGYRIPRWNEVIAFAKKAALHNPEARFIGWDIALTDKGCEMIEGNYYVYCGLLQVFDKSGKYQDIKEYL